MSLYKWKVTWNYALKMNLAVHTASDPLNFDEDEDLGSELEKNGSGSRDGI